MLDNSENMKSSLVQFHSLKFQKKKFRALVAKHFGPQDQKKIIDAFIFAERAHTLQRRDEGDAYIIHPIRVAITLLDNIGTWDSDIVGAALLHDVIEDCGVRRATLQKRFGKRVTHFVEALTRRREKGETEVEKEKRKIAKLKTLQKYPFEVQLIKCADILDNLRCAADVPWWAWTPIARKKFPRWRREFHVAAEFAKSVHPILYREIRDALRLFEVKRMVRGLVRLGF